MITRTQIMNALLAQLQSMGAIATFTRRFSEFTGLSPSAQMPYLMLTRPREMYPQRPAIGLPAKRTFKCMVDIYLAVVGQDPNTIPDDAVCTIMDQLDIALKPPTGKEVQTLGGIVDHCYIVGEVIEVPGDLDGIGMIRVEIEIVVP